MDSGREGTRIEPELSRPARSATAHERNANALSLGSACSPSFVMPGSTRRAFEGGFDLRFAQHHQGPNARWQPQATTRREAGHQGSNRRRNAEPVVAQLHHAITAENDERADRDGEEVKHGANATAPQFEEAIENGIAGRLRRG